MPRKPTDQGRELGRAREIDDDDGSVGGGDTSVPDVQISVRHCVDVSAVNTHSVEDSRARAKQLTPTPMCVEVYGMCGREREREREREGTMYACPPSVSERLAQSYSFRIKIRGGV